MAAVLSIYTVTVCYLPEITTLDTPPLLTGMYYEFTYGNILSQSFLGDFSEILK